ncbi:MAG: hypothetical protein AAF652_11375 [Cyanobacteria bacterium P01_C01_bin.72]
MEIEAAIQLTQAGLSVAVINPRQSRALWLTILILLFCCLDDGVHFIVS